MLTKMHPKVGQTQSLMMPFWTDSMDQVHNVLDSADEMHHMCATTTTTTDAGGPGMMEAATEGALAAGGTVGGIKISREAGTSVRTAASYLPADAQVYCRFLAPRKVALVDCAVRPGEADRTAYVFLPGGLGTMDELFELLTLAQLGKLGSKHPVPIILCKWVWDV